MAEVTIHPEAEAEYEAALAWYLDRSRPAADRFEAAFAEAIEAVRPHPAMFPRCDDHHRFVLLKRFPYTPVYRLDGEEARLIAVAHTKRRPGYWGRRG